MTPSPTGPERDGPDDGSGQRSVHREGDLAGAPAPSGAHAAARTWEGGPPPARRPGRGPKQKKQKALPLWQEVVVLLGLALVLAIVVKAFFVQAFFVPSRSMEPQFVRDDRILVEKWSYWTGDVQRGDVVVFDDPGGWLVQQPAEQEPGNVVQQALEAFGLYPTGGHLVKRVIGTEGDQVVCCDADGRVTVNGVPLEEQGYLMPDVAPSDQSFDVEVPEDSLWVMGDNRPQSGDSRAHTGGPGGGFVPVDGVVGKVWAIVWPLGRTEILDRPEIFADPALDAS